MICRLDRLSENNINPITGNEYDNSWIVLMLTDSLGYIGYILYNYSEHKGSLQNASNIKVSWNCNQNVS